MKVEVADKRAFRVWWQRELNERKDGSIRKNKSGQNRINTICYVATKNGKDILYYGKAIQNSDDNFNKAIGRKVSLTKAIRKFQKTERTIFWENYLKNCKIR